MANNNFCTECGPRLSEGAKFCPNCGNAVAAAAARTEPQNNTYTPNAPQNQAPNYSPNDTQNAPQGYTPNYSPNYTPGFSTRIHDPELQAAVKKNRGLSRIFLLLFMPVPVIVAAIYALVTEEMEFGQAIASGAAVSAIILVINLFIGMSHSSKHAYEAVVIDKKYEYTTIDRNTKGHVYKTIVRTTDGEKKVIQETSNIPRSAYEYLRVGDRFRYHPQLPYPYEKYDKSQDGFVYCACCTKKNGLHEDRCLKCGVPLLK